MNFWLLYPYNLLCLKWRASAIPNMSDPAQPGYHSRYCRIDLTQHTSEPTKISATMLRRFLGGSGLGTYLLLTEQAAPFSITATAPLWKRRTFTVFSGLSRFLMDKFVELVECVRCPFRSFSRLSLGERNSVCGRIMQADKGGTSEIGHCEICKESQKKKFFWRTMINFSRAMARH